MSFGRPGKYQRETAGAKLVVEAQRVIFSHCSNRDPEGVSRQISALQAIAKWCKGDADLSDVDSPGVFVNTPHGSIRAESGQWIVIDAEGVRRVFSDSAFRSFYSPVEGEDEAAKRERLATELLEIHAPYDDPTKAKIEEVASILTLPPGEKP